MRLTNKETTVLSTLYRIKYSDEYLFGKDIALTKQYKKVMFKANGKKFRYISSCILTLRHLIEKQLISFITEPSLYGNTIRKYRIKEIERTGI